MLSHVNTLFRINKRNPEKMSLLRMERMETCIPGFFLHTTYEYIWSKKRDVQYTLASAPA